MAAPTAAGMQRAAIVLYQFVPDTEAGEALKLAAIALIHEKHGNVRGAFAAYQQLERYFPAAANREESLYQLIRTATLLGETDRAGIYAGRLLGDFPKSPRLEEIRAAGIVFSARIKYPFAVEKFVVAGFETTAYAVVGVVPEATK